MTARRRVVICFHFCIFELLETTEFTLFAINQGFKH